MKRITILIVLFFGAVSFLNAQTQQFSNKNNLVVTPEAGDWVLGFDAVPMLNYVGNMLNGNTMNTISTNWANSNNAIYGKYYINQNTAYRASLRLMTFSAKQFTLTDTASAGFQPVYIRDYTKQSGSAIVLGAGLEKRKGKGRVHGFYGADALITLGGSTPNISYGYEMEMNKDNVASGWVLPTRIMSQKAGASLAVGARAFIGVEVFVLPKISLAAEYGWGLTYRTTFDGEQIDEVWDAVNDERVEVTSNTGGSNYFGIDTDNNGGAIKVLFHF